MKTWQAASVGLVLGVGATLGVGAIGHSDVPVGPYFQVNSQEIVNTTHIQTANLVRSVQANGTGPNASPRWMIQLSFENGKEDMLAFDTDDQAKETWRKLQGLLGVEQVAVPRE